LTTHLGCLYISIAAQVGCDIHTKPPAKLKSLSGLIDVVPFRRRKAIHVYLPLMPLWNAIALNCIKALLRKN